MFYYCLTCSYLNKIFYVKTDKEIKGLIQASKVAREQGLIDRYGRISGIIPIEEKTYLRVMKERKEE